MKLVHVTPIARAIGTETLSYFTSSEDVVPGAVVKVPLRTRTVPALVVSVDAVEDMKAEIKSLPFQVRKIGKMKVMPLFMTEFTEAAKDAAEYFASSSGAVLSSMIPAAVLELADKIDKAPDAEAKAPSEIAHEPYALQADEEERLAHYKSLIREQFAKKKSVFFCLPTIQDTKKIFSELPKGIEEFTYVLNSSLSKKELVATWNAILAERHPVLVIGTGSYLCLPRRDLGLIVIERESSTSYKAQVRPYVDVRTFAEFFAKRIDAKLVFGDLLLRAETIWRTKNGEMAELSALKFRSISTVQDAVVDMKRYKTLENPEFRIIGNELAEVIRRTKESNQNMFVFAARRGLSPMTVCGDCATTVLCTRCSAPIILHQGKENYFLCHRCGERRSAEERCKVCGSWRLTTLGIGIELVAEAISGMFPDLKVFRLDKDATKTHKQALAVAENFFNSPGSVLVGTEAALLYLERQVENSGVAAIDSLFSIPDFRINERIMNILLRIRSATQKYFIVQTRSRNQRIFDYAVKGNLMDFYREEIDERRKLGYPPFSTIIKLTAKGTKQSVAEAMEEVDREFAEWNPVIFPAFIETVNKKAVMHAIVKVKRGDWPSKKLAEKLLALPPYVAVNVDPESLL